MEAHGPCTWALNAGLRLASLNVILNVFVFCVFVCTVTVQCNFTEYEIQILNTMVVSSQV